MHVLAAFRKSIRFSRRAFLLLPSFVLLPPSSRRSPIASRRPGSAGKHFASLPLLPGIALINALIHALIYALIYRPYAQALYTGSMTN